MKPVPRRRRSAAMLHLVAGATGGPEAEQQAEAFLRLLASGTPKRTRFWWVYSDGEPQAVALTITSRGRVGFLRHSPADVPGVHETSLAALIRAISLETLRRGAALVQTMIEAPHDADERVLNAAGLENVVELISMECDLTPAEDSASDEWRFVDSRRFRRATLIETIRRTYEDTLDCPRLLGVRSPKEVLASHRTTGIYRPRWWWLAMHNSTPAGCILVNAAATPPAAMIVYMGVAKEFRGRGLGTAMLQQAQRRIHAENMRQMHLTVDANNAYARNLYDRFGFVETGRKRCFVLLPKRSPNGCE